MGSGSSPLPGFTNIDLVRGSDIRRDVTNGLPFPDASIDGIYSEHFLEHLTQRHGITFLRECRRVLKPNGILRIAMPDLDDLVGRYMSSDWRGEGDMFNLGYEWVTNRCEMLNLAMREWGHQWVYNEEELTLKAALAGLQVRGRMEPGESDFPKLRGLEHRPGSKLVMEFSKRAEPPEHPTVSLLIPAYKPRFFEAALASALTQTYPYVEIVICDDCPDRRIEAITRNLSHGDSRVRYERNAEREGPRGNYLRCLALARGDYIKFLNDDDVIEADCVERMAEVLATHPDVTLVTCRRKRIDEEGRPLKDIVATKSLTTTDSIFEGRALARLLLSAERNVVGEPSAVLFRRDDIHLLGPDPLYFGGYSPPGWGDMALWLNLLSQGNAAYLVEPLCHVRVHPDQWQRNPELIARFRSAHPLYTLRRHAFRLGLYRSTRGLPDPLGVIVGFRWRPLGPNRNWKLRVPSLHLFAAFAKAFVDTCLWRARLLLGRNQAASA